MTGSRDARTLCVVVHDVAPPTWDACRRVLDALDALDTIGPLPVTLLAVPSFHGAARDAAFERWLGARAAAGDEVALHGYTHLDERTPRGGIDRLRRRVYTRGEGEFADLPRDEAARRIDAGTHWLRDLGIAPTGFVAPAWLLGDAAWQALRATGFDYTCTLRRLVLLPEGRGVDCQAQVWSTSAAWRRTLSVAWNGTLARLQRDAPIVRLELHPADADHAGVRRSWQRLARGQLATRRAATLREVAARLRTAPAPTSR